MNKIVFGVDVGGTTVKLGVFTADGTVIEKWEIPTRTEESGSHILPDVAESILRKIDEMGYDKENIIGVGIGTPGPVQPNGVVRRAVNLGWGYMNLVEILENLVGLPVKAGNDANVAALGEMWKGGGQGFSDIVAVTLGTGVGGGVIVQGKLVAGATGSGGEIGHINVEENEEEACGCGCKGCLEQYSSATGVVRLARKRLAMDDKPSMLREGELSARSIWDAVKAGDEVAIEVAERFGHYLGKCLAGVAAVVNPEAIVVGGGMSKAGEIMFEYIKPAYQRFSFHATKDVQFKLAQLGNDAGIYGAAKLVIGDK
ncbi:MAG: ROK family glucokinase [Lachnospiraceae bacterium]|nr:ROK family glucokinase [Lachnospiraceae bacterium]